MRNSEFEIDFSLSNSHGEYIEYAERQIYRQNNIFSAYLSFRAQKQNSKTIVYNEKSPISNRLQVQAFAKIVSLNCKLKSISNFEFRISNSEFKSCTVPTRPCRGCGFYQAGDPYSASAYIRDSRE